MLRTIHLYGPLVELAGVNTFKLDVSTPVELINGLRSQIKGFRAWCDEHRIAIVTQDKDKYNAFSADGLMMSLGKSQDVHLLPETEGAGFEASAIVAAIKAGAYATAAYYIAVNIAIAVVVGAVIQALAPSPSTSTAGKADERPSFLYNGAVNVIEQGYAVPIVYGTHMTGSVVISAGVTVEDIPYVPTQATPPANAGGDTQPTSPPTEQWQWEGGD